MATKLIADTWFEQSPIQVREHFRIWTKGMPDRRRNQVDQTFSSEGETITGETNLGELLRRKIYSGN